MRAGQPDLFTKRVRKPPPPPELAVHAMVADVLKLSITPGWLWFHVPNGGYALSRASAGMLQRMGIKAGVSDFLLIAPPAGRVHALELKRRGKQPTEAQTAFLEAVRGAGGLSDWCDDFDTALHILTGWGAVRVAL